MRAAPFIPDAAAKMQNIFENAQDLSWPEKYEHRISDGAEFIVPENSRALAALRELDIDSDGEILISRKFSENGKNAIKINGNTVTVSMLRQVTDSLVDVHGQSEHFFLLKESNQLKTLDTVVGKELLPKKQTLAELLKEKRNIEDRIALLGGDEKERRRYVCRQRSKGDDSFYL